MDTPAAPRTSCYSLLSIKIAKHGDNNADIFIKE